ncbi:hypothetical protein [Anoxybacillus ayderensis]|uniref:hypothetical protein n=1 Tax=Anoxybacillus ayderensis TaxID=265546 RepID=UPI000A26BFBC|nr:hypothetical protein [Anoxybacillus ayderensis]MBA2877641.1 hypothetical protein [Anoxybacillus ayderensis]OSX53460.1 hypothetical protein B7H16_11390 [Anoxybacillus ayderensis]
MNKLEKELQSYARAKHEKHDAFMKAFETWGKEMEATLNKLEKINDALLQQFQANMSDAEAFFAKKEKQFARMFHHFR